MVVEIFDKYIQINLHNNSYFCNKTLSFANKHFVNNIRLSSSILLLDESTQRYKKEYFLNWVLHMCENSEKENLKSSLLSSLHLPVRIKFSNKDALLERVCVSMRFVGSKKIILELDRNSKLARRYLISKFRDHIIGYTKTEIFLKSSAQTFWEQLAQSITEKRIHNIALKFEYSKFDSKSMFSSNYSYLTKDEKRIRESYTLLESNQNDDFLVVKNRYLKLAREYHPDNVFGQNSEIVDHYVKKFRMIRDAYENIKRINYRAA